MSPTLHRTESNIVLVEHDCKTMKEKRRNRVSHDGSTVSTPITSFKTAPLHRTVARTTSDYDTESTCTCSTGASSVRSTRSSSKRHVTFAVSDDYISGLEDVDGLPPVHCVIHDSEGPLSKEEKDSLWWKPMEYRLFRRHCKKAAMAAQESEYKAAFVALYDACEKATSSLSPKDCRRIANVSVRGLEVVIHPTMIQRRRMAIKGVIKAQEKLPTIIDEDERAKLLSGCSRYLSKQSRMLARVLGKGDAAVALEAYGRLFQRLATPKRDSGEDDESIQI